jgi:hypothetical protein
MKLNFIYSIHQNKSNDSIAAYVAGEITPVNTAVNGVEEISSRGDGRERER